jgi:hypothetical protein
MLNLLLVQADLGLALTYMTRSLAVSFRPTATVRRSAALPTPPHLLQQNVGGEAAKSRTVMYCNNVGLIPSSKR